MPPSVATAPASSSATAVPTVENLQALRGLAAMLVVFAHLRVPVGTLAPIANYPLLRTVHDAIGVDLFFVISGYVISLTACKRHHRPLDFFLARIARVTPSYLFVTVPYLIFGLATATLATPAWRAAWNGFFYLPIFDWKVYTPPPLDLGWTLSFEMWFYVVFTLLLCWFKPARVPLLLPIVFLIGAIVMTPYHGAWFFPHFAFHPFVVEFSLGCAIYHFQRWIGPKVALLLFMLSMAITFGPGLHSGDLGWHLPILDSRTDLAWWRVLLWGVPCALLAASLIGWERHRVFVVPAVLTWLGDISYSLYLTHHFSFAISRRLGLLFHIHQPVLVILWLAGFSIPVAWAYYRVVEKPLTTRAQDAVRRYIARTSRPAPVELAAKP